MIYDKNNIYAGGFKDEMKEGIGIQFIMNPDKESGWYYYQGEWNYNMPNGMGKTVEEKYIRDNEGNLIKQTIKTSGMFIYGLEDGQMQKEFYENDEEKGYVNYTVDEGIPRLYLDEYGQEVTADLPGYYVIGKIYHNNEPTGEYYSIKAGIRFSVKLN